MAENGSQCACVDVKYLSIEAKERQREAGKMYGENHPKELPQKIAEPLKNRDNESAVKAAGMVVRFPKPSA